jgi:hypothetical protein
VIEHFEERLDEFADMMYEQTHVEMSDADLDSISPEYLVHANAIMRETRRKLKWTYRAPHHPRRSLIVAGPRPTVSSPAWPTVSSPAWPTVSSPAWPTVSSPAWPTVSSPAWPTSRSLRLLPAGAGARAEVLRVPAGNPGRRAACYNIIWFNL